MRSPVQIVSVALAGLLAGSAVADAGTTLTTWATAGSTSLVMDGMGSASVHIVKIAEVTVSTDAVAGITLFVSSGSLSKGDGRTSIPFQLVLVEHDASAPSSAAFTTPSGSTFTFATNAAGPLAKDIYIKYLPASLQDPGSYSASVELAVTDN